MIISLRNITLSHSSLPLITHGDLFIEAGERVGLIGRNGSGKSTLLKMINGEVQPDEGMYEKNTDLRIALLPQAVPEHIPGTVEEIVTRCLPVVSNGEWQDTSLVAKTITKLKLNGQEQFTQLSGGMRRLVLLSCILVQDPDVLMLDEPTNHLDISIITILENLLLNFRKTIIFITHDRELLQKLATHIVEIDNGSLISWRGNYQDYLRHKETVLAAEAKANALFDKKLAQEEQWIRQGIKARRTRNEGRVTQLKKMRAERAERRTRVGQIAIGSQTIATSGKIVFEAKGVSFNYQDKKIIDNFSTTILRGDKVGIIGSNGVGKTTLVQLLLGNLQPTQGSVRHGTKLTIGYFDQHRLALNDDQTIYEAVSELGETIRVDNTDKHIYGYLQDFLFSPKQARTQIKNLSGGERNRVMLAKIFSRPCNVLVLDEPTNDLDIETLELLEEKLLSYSGSLLLISHDRAFINNIVTSTIVFAGNGKIEEYLGGYDDWLSYQTTPIEKQSKIESTKSKLIADKNDSRKLTYKEQQELNELPGLIERLESRQNEINQQLADPSFYKENANLIASLTQELDDIEQQLISSYDRWQKLEKLT